MADQDNDPPRLMRGGGGGGGTDTASSCSTSSPLLFLLDGVLSHDDDRIQEALAEIARLVAQSPSTTTSPPHNNNNNNSHGGKSGTFPLTVGQPYSSSAMLCRVVAALLDVHPAWASVSSEHDGSLPLHFAASLGNVQVAKTILEKVRDNVFSKTWR
jgi:hypothetical protein